jgi:hypothetical protein
MREVHWRSICALLTSSPFGYDDPETGLRAP